MNSYSIKQLSVHLSLYLKELPFAITNHNRVVAVVIPSTEKKLLDGETITTKDAVESLTRAIAQVKEQKVIPVEGA